MMQLADMKRAVEDVLLRPELGDGEQLAGRATLAALDLCQPDAASPSPCSSTGCASSSVSTRTCSSSVETVGGAAVSPSSAASSTAAALLATSTSLDHIVLRQQQMSRSGGVSRRSSRILPHHTTTSRRKRSNSLSSSCYKGGALSAAPSSLPPTARATPFRDSSSEASALRTSFASTESGEDSLLLQPAASSSFDEASCGDVYTIPGQSSEFPGDFVPPPINGIHEDEEMECD